MSQTLQKGKHKNKPHSKLKLTLWARARQRRYAIAALNVYRHSVDTEGSMGHKPKKKLQTQTQQPKTKRSNPQAPPFCKKLI
jgi:hypothetical protein